MYVFIKSSRTVAAVIPLRRDFFKSSGNEAAPSTGHYRPSVTSSLGVWQGRHDIETRRGKKGTRGRWVGRSGRGADVLRDEKWKPVLGISDKWSGYLCPEEQEN